MFRTIALAAVLVSAFPAAARAQGLKLSPLVVYAKLPPGESDKQTWTLENTTSSDMHFTLSTTDAWSDSEGKRTFPQSGSGPQGLGKWLSLPAKTHLRVPAKGKLKVEGSVTVPPDAAPQTYLGGYVLTFEHRDSDKESAEPPEGIAAGAKVITKIVLLVHVDVRPQASPAPTPQVEILAQKVDPPEGAKPLSVKLLLINHGKYEIKPEGTLAILGEGSKVFGKATFASVSVWPSQRVWIEAQYPERLPPGKYTGFAAFALQDPTGQGESYNAPPLQYKVQFQTGGAPALAPPPRPVAEPQPSPPQAKPKTHGT